MDKKESIVLIDTDVLINFLDKNKKFNQVAENAFYNFENKNIEPFVSIITTIEIIQGNKTNIEKKRILRQLEPFGNISLSDEICRITKNLIITYSSSHGLLMGDAFIAATALYLHIQLFTFNKKDFRFIKNLKLYEP
ncbi:MAG: PIN domain-containing protein [Bacteroidota bacterium]|nr:PIN domain-containing protein [Bacteroidota bacterium]